jgi:hypothetical protein
VGKVGKGAEEKAEEVGTEGAGHRHLELHTRGGDVLPHLRHPPEDEERDAIDGDAVAIGHQGVRELVQEDGGEEEKGGQQGHGHIDGGARGHVDLEELQDHPEEQREDDEPAPVDEDVDPPESSDAQAFPGDHGPVLFTLLPGSRGG